jgi:FG-GAP-like repeat
MNNRRARIGMGLWLVLVAGGVAAAAVAGYVCFHRPGDVPPPPPAGPEPPADVAAQVHQFCGACHAYPPPDSFPRSAWEREVRQGYSFFQQSNLPLHPPPVEAVIRYYQDRAPAELPAARPDKVATPPPVRFERLVFAGPPGASPPAVSNVNLVHLSDPRRLDVLACDMRRGLVAVLQPWAESPSWRVLARLWNPAHTEVVDLDGDGIPDVLVADLGNFAPTDDRCGSVVWLRGSGDGRFTPHTLLQGVGRVADVRAADFRGTGKKDLVVAAFGLHTNGEILFLENQTDDWARPRFVPRVLDPRHGTIHVPVCDLDGDGRPDFVALISQEHETVVAFLNQGNGQFRKETLYTAPHPAWGSSGIELVDLDGDGDLDVLYTNGDALDRPYLLKPYHGVQWLENRTEPGGPLSFVHHPLVPLYGAHRAVAADLTGRGKKDVVAVSFLPAQAFPQRQELGLDSVLLLEQTEPGRFACHSLEAGSCDHVTCALGDVFGTGRADLVIGTNTTDQAAHALTVWKNLGPAAGGR